MMKAIKIASALGVGMLLSLGASAQQLVKVGYAPFAPPLSFLPGATPDNYRELDPNGTMAQGALIDLMNAIAKDAGFKVEFVTVPASDQIAALSSNRIDLALSTIIDRGAAADFTDPLYRDSEALLVKKSDDKQYSTWEDLKGEVIVTLKGSPFANAAQKSGIFKEVRLVTTGAEVVQSVRDPEIKAGRQGLVVVVQCLLRLPEFGIDPKSALSAFERLHILAQAHKSCSSVVPRLSQVWLNS